MVTELEPTVPDSKLTCAFWDQRVGLLLEPGQSSLGFVLLQTSP